MMERGLVGCEFIVASVANGEVGLEKGAGCFQKLFDEKQRTPRIVDKGARVHVPPSPPPVLLLGTLRTYTISV